VYFMHRSEVPEKLAGIVTTTIGSIVFFK
jgi:hypothetical protein